MDEKLDEVTTSPPRGSRAAGVGRPPRPQRVEQRKLSSRNFYANERKKCKSGPGALAFRSRGGDWGRRGGRTGGLRNLNASSFREPPMPARLCTALVLSLVLLPSWSKSRGRLSSKTLPLR